MLNWLTLLVTLRKDLHVICLISRRASSTPAINSYCRVTHVQAVQSRVINSLHNHLSPGERGFGRTALPKRDRSGTTAIDLSRIVYVHANQLCSERLPSRLLFRHFLYAFFAQLVMPQDFDFPQPSAGWVSRIAHVKLCRTGRLYELEKWIADGRSLEISAAKQGTLLQVAIHTGFHSLIELIAKHDNQSSKNASLGDAVALRRLDFVRLLVENGADAKSVPFA